MKSTFATLALVGAAAAAPHAGHAAFHAKKDIFSDLTNLGSLDGLTDLESKMTALATNGLAVMKNMGAEQAINSNQATDHTWLAEAQDGDAVVNTVVNKGDKDIVFACWGSASWVNTNKPTIAVQVPAGKNVTISHAVGQSGTQNTGACAPVFSDTGLVNGQISESWLEFTFTNGGMYSTSTYDLSKEVNMSGANMTIAGPTCVSDHSRCYFQCTNGENSCWQDYELVNCAAGSQQGAQAGKSFGKDTGGCSDISNTGITKLTTTIH